MPIANQIKTLAEDIEAAYGARVAAVSDIVNETHQTLGNFNRAHKKMADDLRDLLSASEKERSASEKERIEEFTTLIGEIKGAVTTIAKDTAETLADFHSSHREMARQLREELSSFQNKLERIVREMRSPVIADLKEAKQNWQNLAKVMAATRAGKSIPSPRAEMGVPEAIKEEAEEAFEEGEIKDRVLRVIQSHPAGIKLAEIGKVLGIAFIRAAKPIQELLTELKITRRDKEYLPA